VQSFAQERLEVRLTDRRLGHLILRFGALTPRFAP
jgi:hypothetical protein